MNECKSNSLAIHESEPCSPEQSLLLLVAKRVADSSGPLLLDRDASSPEFESSNPFLASPTRPELEKSWPVTSPLLDSGVVKVSAVFRKSNRLVSP